MQSEDNSRSVRVKFDLHVHSKFSRDSLSEPKDIVSVAKRHGIGGIAITDHDVLGRFPSNVAKDLIIIKGSEVKTEIGDIIGLFLTENIRSNISFRVVDEIRDQGGLVILPHPYRDHILSAWIIEEADAIEGFNARVSQKGNERAIELCIKKGKPMIAGSDAHFSFEVGRASTVILYASSEEDVRKAILSKNTSIEGLQFSNKYLSFLYTRDKIIEGMKNPEIILSMALKSAYRSFRKLKVA